MPKFKMPDKAETPKLLIQSPKGTHDILPDDYALYQSIFEKAEEISSYYGFRPIQTPHFEKTDLFTAAIGESTDIVEKEMYAFKTKGGDRLALRPEGTAPVMRSYIENGMHTLPQPVMLWYKGSFFRHENPQKGRFREFQQFGLEIIGEPKTIAEAIIIQVLTLILKEIGIEDIIVNINSIGDKECRTNYRKELMNYYRKKFNALCGDCKKRFKKNPLRMLDCKKPKCVELKQDVPQLIDYLCNNCKQSFREVLEFLEASDTPYFLDNHLVRGLDYYTRTVFEIFEDTAEKIKGAADEGENEKKTRGVALVAGGRYDGLAKTLGKKDIPAVGGAIGIDRVVQILRDRNIKPQIKKTPKIFFIQLGAAARYKSLSIMEMLRKAGVPIEQSLCKDNLRGQLKLASKLNMPYVLILGQKEALDSSIIVRDMESGVQETVAVEKIIETIKRKIK
ncbi:histidine--tRNA ligase [Candidatus Parcubacteria bacterium]|nr:histidine--tRNA ligase [Patescibacteria group bacterium]MBU4476855.1 histidine--tRNA ligase [Patescibacteria group bacterium]MCG2699271.1 histidine--tRNA ligase [Candidatus Parcubacteria bacterium]